MSRVLLIVVSLLLPSHVWAAGGGPTFPNDEIEIDWNDKASMQRGARTFVNYCLSCHSAAYSRFDRIGRDLGMTDDLVRDNLIFTTDVNGDKTKVGELMKINMTREYAEAAFGTVPPDLSLIARSRGVNWLYNYLRSFYVDESRTGLGVNNGVFANVGMPHVLAELQGLQKGIFTEHEDDSGMITQHFEGFEMISPGSLDAEDFDSFVTDTVNFLAYIAEPIRSDRRKLGVWVFIYLIVFLVIASMLKKQIWKDVK